MPEPEMPKPEWRRKPLSLREWGVIVVGLTLGLFLGNAILRGGPQIDPWDTAPHPPRNKRNADGTSAAGRRPGVIPRVADAAAEPSREEPDRELEVLRRRVAQLEKRQLEQRLAALEADLDAPASDFEEGVEPSPGNSRPAQTEPSPADSATHDSLQAGAKAQRSAASQPPSRSGGRAASASEPRSAPKAASPAAPTVKGPNGPATLAWWNGLNSVIAREAVMRTAPANLTAANAGGFMEARIQAGRFAASAIAELDGTSVDPDALALGRDLVAWYQEEAALAERANSLLGSNDVAARKGSAGNAWKSSEEQHGKKVDEINRRGATLRTRLSGKYGLAFPALN